VQTAPAQKMRHLPAPLRGLVLDHLEFADVLRATTTDSTGRASLGYVRRISNANDRVVSAPHVMSKLRLCETLFVSSKSALVLGHVAWALHALRHLRDVVIDFKEGADMHSWRHSCETLACSPELGRLGVFFIEGLSEAEFNTDALQSLLVGLPPNCALAYVLTLTFAPASTVSKLLARGADLHADLVYPTPPLRVNPLAQAANGSRLEVVRLLLDAGARGRSKSDQDPIFVAARRSRAGAFYTMRLLYDSGLRSNHRTDRGYNLLHFLTFPALNHHTPSTVLAIAKLVCEHQPELLTEYSNNGYSPLALLANRQCVPEWRDSPSERAALTRELTILLGTKEAKFRRGSRR
tara:strand:+ start:79 stop:1131 length:1053 start_codon:yes stop_codon:yes gene_type:complete